MTDKNKAIFPFPSNLIKLGAYYGTYHNYYGRTDILLSFKRTDYKLPCDLVGCCFMWDLF